MPNYATCTIVGHLGRDPELRHTPSGDPVASFSVATSRKRKDETTTTWWRVSLFGRRGEVVAQHLRKGDPILVTGEPFLREYTGNDGQQRTSLEIMASDFAFVGRSEAAQGVGGAKAYQGGGSASQTPPRDAQDDLRKPSAGDGYDDDIPF